MHIDPKISVHSDTNREAWFAAGGCDVHVVMDKKHDFGVWVFIVPDGEHPDPHDAKKFRMSLGGSDYKFQWDDECSFSATQRILIFEVLPELVVRLRDA